MREGSQCFMSTDVVLMERREIEGVEWVGHGTPTSPSSLFSLLPEHHVWCSGSTW